MAKRAGRVIWNSTTIGDSPDSFALRMIHSIRLHRLIFKKAPKFVDRFAERVGFDKED